MYQLTARTGSSKGRSWLIGGQRLRIGRSVSCEVNLSDPTVSRQHCEVWLEGSEIHIRDLKSSNSTLINGRPANDAVLSVGDEVAIGAHGFMVTSLAYEPRGQLDPTPPKKPDSSVTLTVTNAFYVQEQPISDASGVSPRTVEEFRKLFLLSRRFSRSNGRAQLVETFVETLMHEFEPEALWLAWYMPRDKGFVLYPLEDCGAFDFQAPLESMGDAVEKRAGLLLPGMAAFAGNRRFQTTMVSPLLMGDDAIGAIAMISGAPHRVYDEEDLQYFLALSHTFAPFVRAAERQEQLHRDVEQLEQRAGVSRQLLGDSQVMHDVRKHIARAAECSLNVLLTGETGTGKELAARMVHDLSERSTHPFIVVNCAAIPRELFESEMFGHERGAFTGAVRQKLGRFEEAHGGTLFLDEIGDLSQDNQARILRAIETGSFYRVGGSRSINVSVRIVAATNKILIGAASHNFRKDLYHRLNGVSITLPPLRARGEDVIVLAEAFLRRNTAAAAKNILGFTQEAIERMREYSWPGNVRELNACIERAAAFARGELLGVEDICFSEDELPYDSSELICSMAEAERHHIDRMVRHCNGNIKQAAELLEISRTTLYSKIRQYNIET